MIRRELRRVWPALAGEALAGVLLTACSLGFVWLTKLIIDIATGKSDVAWSWAVAGLVAAILLRTLSSALSGRLGASASTRFSNRLRTRLFVHALSAKWQGRAAMHSSDALGRMVSDVGTLSIFLCQTGPGMVSVACQLAGAFIFLAILNWQMALAITAIMPLALWLSKIFTKTSHRLTHRIRESESAVNRLVQEGLLHRLLLNTLRADRYLEAFQDAQGDFYRNAIKRNDISLYSAAAVGIGFMGAYTVAFLWCADGLKNGSVTFGVMTAFMQLVAMVQRPVVEMARKVPAFINARVAYERISEVFNTPQGCGKLNQGKLKKDGCDVQEVEPMEIQLRGVSYVYPDGEKGSENLHYSDFTFRKGEVTAITGETGAGKTTLLMLLLGFAKPEKGAILKSGKGEIAFVPQGNSLFSGTVRENLQLANPEATDADMEQALRDACAGFLFEAKQGLDTLCGESGSGLSEGEAQRIAIARGLLCGAGTIILDEPTSALDADTELELMRRLRRRLSGKTVIVVTHRSNTIAACDSRLHIG